MNQRDELHAPLGGRWGSLHLFLRSWIITNSEASVQRINIADPDKPRK